MPKILLAAFLLFAAPATFAQTNSDSQIVAQEARTFFVHLLAGDARGLVQRSAVPFQIEDQRFGSPKISSMNG